MKEKFSIYGNEIDIKYSSPETGISEDFDFLKKHFYMTIGVQKLFIIENEIQKRVIATNIINKVCEKAKIEVLDYFLKIEINGNETWLIDNGNDICLMLPEEY
ncbi:hypothetical protein H3C61_01300 [Candidatus Gracilibacteria bacterium]|nr:hypothetical protein [Candidatus Gracilibacteria bacterium]